MAMQFQPDPSGLGPLLAKYAGAPATANAAAAPVGLPDSIDPSASKWVGGPQGEKQDKEDHETTRQDRNDARTSAAEAQRLAMEHARLVSELRSKGMDLGPNGEVVQSAPVGLGDSNLHGPEYLATLPQNIRNRVQQLLDGRSMLTAREKGQPLGQQLMDAANQADPTFDENVSKARFNERQQFTGAGKASVIAQSGNRLAQHINDLYAASEALPGVDLGIAPLSNAADHVQNWFHQPTVVQYNTTLPFISGELQKLTKNGTATVDETKHIMENLSPAQPRDVRRGAIQELVKLAQGQFQPFRDSWASAWQGTTAPPPPMDFNDTTQHIFDNITAGGKPLDLDHNGHIVGLAAGGAPPNSGGGGSGGTPPTPFNLDDSGGPLAAGALAAPGSSTKSIPVPAAMQAEYESYVAKNRGALDPDAYATFRAGLDSKYGFGPGGEDKYRAEAVRDNGLVRKGVPLNLGIPPADEKMTGLDKVNASIFNNPVGAAVMGAGSLGGGADELFGTIKGLATGGDISSNIAGMNAMRQAEADAHPLATPLGQVLGAGVTGFAAGGLPLIGGATESLGGTAALGAGYGAATGAMENNDNRLGGAMGGAIAGSIGGLAGKYAVAPIAQRIGASKVGQGVADLVDRGLGAMGKDPLDRLPVPDITPADKIVVNTPGNLALVRQNIADAAELGLPYSLADADPKLRMLAGAVARKSVDARTLAENVLDPRAMGQADRAVEAIDTHLAPVTNLEGRAKSLLKAGSASSGPDYNLAMAQPAPVDPQLNAMLQTDLGRRAMASAKQIAEMDGKDPNALGFIADPHGNVSLNDISSMNAGRFSPATIGDPSTELTRTTVRGTYGPVPKVGPVDMVGWLRLNGGLQDSGGELANMGLNNAARKLDFAGQEQRFGPLINPDKGMNFDDAAHAAWEAGYFPSHSDRPTINEFLDALRGTHEGWDRKFLPEDVPEIERYNVARQQAGTTRGQRFEDGKMPVVDNSYESGPQPPLPDEAYAQNVVQAPTFETLQYVKRGLDAEVEKNRNALGQLDLQGDPMAAASDRLRNRFAARLGELNPDFAAANAEYARYAKRADALNMGYDTLPKTNVPQRTFDDALARAQQYDATVPPEMDHHVTLPEIQRGYATSMADTVNKSRLAADPYNAIYGSPLQQGKVGALFPDGSSNFDRIYTLERDMAKTRNEVMGGSPTAGRLQADQQLGGDVLGELGANALGQAMTGGGVPALGTTGLALARKYLGDSAKLGIGSAAQRRAEKLAPVLLNTDPASMMPTLDDLIAGKAAQDARDALYAKYGALFGGAAGPLLISGGS